MSYSIITYVILIQTAQDIYFIIMYVYLSIVAYVLVLLYVILTYIYVEREKGVKRGGPATALPPELEQ